MYAYRQEGCIESIAPAHPTYPRHHLNSHHVNYTHRHDPRRCSMHAGAIAKSLFVVASLPLDLHTMHGLIVIGCPIRRLQRALDLIGP